MGWRVESRAGPGGTLRVLMKVMVVVMVGRVGVQSLGLVGRNVESGLLDGVRLSRGLLKPVTSDPAQCRRKRLSRLQQKTMAEG